MLAQANYTMAIYLTLVLETLWLFRPQSKEREEKGGHTHPKRRA